MLAHVLRVTSPQGPRSLIAHTWWTDTNGKTSSPCLATLHRNMALLHILPGNDPSQPPIPAIALRPCSEARCLDLLALPLSPSCQEKSDPNAAHICSLSPSKSTFLVAVGGSFGLELHWAPPDEARPPRRLLSGASVSILQFSKEDGQFLAVACLDGRVGVLDVQRDLLGQEADGGKGGDDQQQRGLFSGNDGQRSLGWASAVVSKHQ